jgi:hypothetical protein
MQSIVVPANHNSELTVCPDFDEDCATMSLEQCAACSMFEPKPAGMCPELSRRLEKKAED